MSEKFDINSWINEVESFRPEANRLALLLENYGATVMPENSREVGSIPFIVTFNFDDDKDVKVTVRIIFKDHQTNSDVVITNMTTLPGNKKGMGFGSRAMEFFLKWAKDNNLKDVRATQVDTSNENFWSKNGFVKAEGINPCNDFVYIFSRYS